MKKQVAEFIKSLGGTSGYSGKTKTMYVKGGSIMAYDIEIKVIEVFGYGLPFKMATSSY